MNRTYMWAATGWSIGLVAALILAAALGTGYLANVLLGLLCSLGGVILGVRWAER